MKKVSLAVLLAGGMISGVAQADNQSVSVGYAQSKVEDFKNIRGVNLQYRYEFDSPVSLLGSFTYMKGDDDQNYFLASDYVQNHVEAKYYSLLVGPAYRLNEYVSLYALGGVTRTKADGHTTWHNAGDNYVGRETISADSTSFAYGAGVIFNPVENFTVNVGYEGTNADLEGDRAIDGFNVGVGYRF